MKKTDIIPVNNSREFAAHEKFFSITDRKGIIKCCNNVFIKVSDYPSTDILEKPHNIIRHPDMPRCIFKLLWDYLLADKPIAAYVKNMARTGEYYWVYALAAPVDNGYLSIRIKPEGPVFETVKELYKELKSHEDEFGLKWKEGMASAGELLMKRLSDLGFSSYEDFMSESLRLEFTQHIKAEQEILNDEEKEARRLAFLAGSEEGRLQYIFDNVDDLKSLERELQAKKLSLEALNKNLKMIALNSGIQASHLGEKGRALGVVSNEIARISSLVSVQMNKLRDDINHLSNSLKAASFYCSLTLLQNNMKSNFKHESLIITSDPEEQRNLLGKSLTEIDEELVKAARDSYKRFATDLSSMKASFKEFDDFLQSLARIIQTLDFSYVTGKTLAAQTEDGKGFSYLISALKTSSENACGDLYGLRNSLELVQGKLITFY